MTIEQQTQTEEQSTPQAPVITDEMSYQDYERMRMGLTLESKPNPSALADTSAEQKKESSESDTEETDAKEEEELEASEPDSDEEEGKEEAEKPKKKGGFQRRIDKLNARYAEERARSEALEKRLAQLEAGAKPKEEKVETAKVEAQEGKPNPDDFDTHTAYVEAVADWKYEQRKKADDAKSAQAKLEAENKAAVDAHFKREAEYSAKTPGYKELIDEMNSFKDASITLGSIIVNSENGPELMHALAKNPDEYHRINKLGPIAAAREIGKIEAKLAASSTPAPEEKKPESKKITKAPKPIEPVGAGKGSVKRSIHDDDLPFDEYERLRRDQMKRRNA